VNVPEMLEVFLLPALPAGRDAWGWASVTQASPLRVRLDGDAAALDLTPDTLTGELAVGRRVWVQITGGRVIVHGASGGP